jgi:hypothetical protein
MADPNPKDGGKLPADVEIAWARAISRAFHDAAFHRRLKANPARVLTKLGADVSGIDVKDALANGRLTPSLEALDDVHEDLELKREALRGAEGSTCCTPSSPTYCPPSNPTCCPSCGQSQAWQPGIPGYGAGHPTSIHLHVPTLGPASQSFGTSGCMTTQTYACGAASYMSGCATFRWGCIAASQVATMRATAAPGGAAPQWIGGRPSGGLPVIA